MPSNPGINFEEELAEELGLERVPGSGAVWHSKLDLKGKNFRWSLKSTIRNRIPIGFVDLVEAFKLCYGPGGDGASPIWAFRNPIGDFVLMRKEDFKALQEGKLNLIEEDRPHVAARKSRARIPELLREE